MEKKQPIALFTLSFILTVCLFFLDESSYSLSFFLKYKEVINLLLFTAVISGLPLLLYFTFRRQLRNGSFYLALLGYLPVLFLLAKIVGF